MGWYLSGVHDLTNEPAAAVVAEDVTQSPTRAIARSVGRQFGNQLILGILGGLFRGR
ncbi:hypothetical protein [Sphingomonas sp.]|uniref:hypothetical protein n=1 Tax=Sphingomonas sp. TaxID=28214 RepID=UPI002869F16E|nr:hypothetical protein [Sphingomonas sp.]